jgi:hypothetical protein
VFDKVKVKIWVRSSRDRKELILDMLEPRALADPAVLEKRDGDAKKKKLKTKK